GEEQTTTLDGGTWAAATTPLALVLVAAIAATFAVKGWLNWLVAALVALVAVAAAIPAVTLLSGGASEEKVAAVAQLPARADVHTVTVSALGPVLVLVGSVAALIAAVLVARRPRTSGGLSSKYDAPAARRAAAAPEDDELLTQRMMWDALDAGDDPTLDDDPTIADEAVTGVAGGAVVDGDSTPRKRAKPVPETGQSDSEPAQGSGPGRGSTQSAD
ncbi:MAG: TIGR02234 family membrane protein, partial [Rhodococcus sp.]|nr:TIGR02234 family membrane protein [Rhodococcus sp. (in: high G+C Gram-positive bacteria)]